MLRWRRGSTWECPKEKKTWRTSVFEFTVKHTALIGNYRHYVAPKTSANNSLHPRDVPLMHNFVLEKCECSKPRKERTLDFESSLSPRQTFVVSSFPEDDTANGYKEPLALLFDYSSPWSSYRTTDQLFHETKYQKQNTINWTRKIIWKDRTWNQSGTNAATERLTNSFDSGWRCYSRSPSAWSLELPFVLPPV